MIKPLIPSICVWLALSLMVPLLSPGCATTKLATRAGSKIAENYQEAAAMGAVTAEQSIDDWPYISGLIKGIFAGDYELDMPISAQRIIDALDKLALQETLSLEDKGRVIGYFCRLEAMAIQEGWDRYGASITGAIRSVFI